MKAEKRTELGNVWRRFDMWAHRVDMRAEKDDRQG